MQSNIEVNVETAQKLGLLPEEFEQIKTILGRTPNFTELSLYSVMWSEHCSYKNSIYWLKKLPKEGSKILAEAGTENAGLVDIGDDIACCFKIESHNHPSAVEPYQGAATGVGGINRDIFTMGARPIAQLNSLRFGNIDLAKTKRLLKGVVKGIGDYGNAFGVPVVGGEVYFDECYNTNPLVNAMSVGIVKKNQTVSAISKGVGNPVFIVGSSTGKDGIHGATFASEDITEASSEKLPSVQVGDPFQEKLLLEASLEVIKTGAIVGMQDMGAAGIICSTSEMSAKGNHGMIIYLDKVPLRQSDMQAFEILLSESQERMLLVVEKGREAEVKTVFGKWDLNCVQIGEVTAGNILQYYMHGKLVAEVPADSLVLGGGAPVYQRSWREPAYLKKIESFSIENYADITDIRKVFVELLSHPTIASKRWIYEQYDSMVGTKNMSTNLPSDAAIVKIKGTNKALALTVDCNSKYVFANPEKGASIAVAEAARNIVCSGGKPIAITNCLNFGNPYNEEVYWQFVCSIKGMSEACKAFDTPVTGGNVSFYNQTSIDDRIEPIYPTPVIGMLGILDNKETQMTLDFKKADDYIYLIGNSKNDIGSSIYLSLLGELFSACPSFDIQEELNVQQTITMLIEKKLIVSAHDVSEGGLMIALFESAKHRKLGFEITTDDTIRKDAFLFGEAQSRVVVSVEAQMQEEFVEALSLLDTNFSLLGKVTNGNLIVDTVKIGNITDFIEVYDCAIENKMKEF